jgi:hypothetical protein
VSLAYGGKAMCLNVSVLPLRWRWSDPETTLERRASTGTQIQCPGYLRASLEQRPDIPCMAEAFRVTVSAIRIIPRTDHDDDVHVVGKRESGSPAMNPNAIDIR